MAKVDYREIYIAMAFLCLGMFSSVPAAKKYNLEKIKNDKVVEIIWKKYTWKTKRLRVYVDEYYKLKNK